MAEHPEDVKPDRLTREDLIEPIIAKLIDAAGGLEAVVDGQVSIRELNGNLIIKTTPEKHTAIARRLVRIRDERYGRLPVDDESENDSRSVDPDEARGLAAQRTESSQTPPPEPDCVSVLFDPNPLPRLLEVVAP